jgi:hypothetical protein
MARLYFAFSNPTVRKRERESSQEKEVQMERARVLVCLEERVESVDVDCLLPPLEKEVQMAKEAWKAKETNLEKEVQMAKEAWKAKEAKDHITIRLPASVVGIRANAFALLSPTRM